MKRMFRTVATLGLVAAVAGLGAAVTAAPQFAKKADGKAKTADAATVKVGETVPDFTLPDLDGKEHSLSDFEGKTIVLEWTNPGCPYVVGVYKHGIVKQTVEKINEMDDVVYIAINSTGNMSKEAVIKQNKAFLKEHNVDVPVLIDYDGKVGKMFGAKHTPDLYVIDSEMTLRYLGGYTDDYRFKNGTESMNYVTNALTQIKAGETVAPDSARRWGCSVKYASK